MFYSPFDNTADELTKLKESFAEEKLFFEELSCPYCKTRVSDLLETGYVGCANCYNVFSSELIDLIYNYQKSMRHVGKKPDRVASRAKKQNQIEELLKQQQAASANEDFLLAQSIKEQIEKLRSEL